MPNIKLAASGYPSPRNGPRGQSETMLLKSLKVLALENNVSMGLNSRWEGWLSFALARLQGFIKVKYVPFMAPQANSLNSGLFSTEKDNKYVGELICGQCVSLTPKDNKVIGLQQNKDFFRMVFEKFRYHPETLPRCVTVVFC
jgi:hypothetical protein